MDIEDIKKLYTRLILQGMISFSILAQFILFLWIFFRKGNPIGSISRILWLGVHLVADSIAALSLANIFQNSMTPSAAGCQENAHQINLLALWATFILLQLGGHNTIIAFTLEDNQCWWIHLLKFIVYVATTFIISLLSLIEGQISCCVLILLLAGISKSCERVLAIKRGSINRLRRSAQKISDAAPYSFHDNGGDIEEGRGQGSPAEESQLLPDIKALCDAYECFAGHKDIYVDHEIISGGVNGFWDKTIDNSIKLLEMELGFAYNMFYSKSFVIDKFWGSFFRATSSVLIVTGGILLVSIERHKLLANDPVITIILLLKAVTLECVSFLVSLFSNHDTLKNIGYRPGRIWRKLESIILAFQNYQRQCTKVGQFNLLSYSIRDRKSWNFVKSFLQLFDFKEFSDNCRYSKHVSLDNDLRILLFKIVKSMPTKTQHEQDRIGMFAEGIKPTALGYDIIQQLTRGNPTVSVDGRQILIESCERSFEERLLIYHVATELYYDHKANQGNESQREERNPSRHVSVEDKKFLNASKILSDYMLYLLVAHPSLLLPVLTPELRSYRDTRDATLRFFHDYCSQNDKNPYETMRDKYTTFSEIYHGKKYKNSVALDGIKVAKYLISKRNDDTGGFLCQLWLEMLCFAASQCKGQSHAKQLGKGRELFTIIWLYMIHLGISYEYVLQKTGNIFFVPGNKTAEAPQEGQNNNYNSTAMASQEGQNNNEDSTDAAPQESQNNSEDSTAVAPQEGENNDEDSIQEQ